MFQIYNVIILRLSFEKIFDILVKCFVIQNVMFNPGNTVYISSK